MKKTLLLSAALFIAVMGFGQTQQGYVKTIGRMVNGKYEPGEGLTGAVVSIQNHNPVIVQNRDGSFSFLVPKEMKFHIDSVNKKGFELLDYSQLRTHTYCGDTLWLTMENPAKQQAYLREKQREWQRNLESVQRRLEDSIQNLNISLEEKNKKLAEIDQQREVNEKYIQELAKYYSTIDYDRISDFQRQIISLLEGGDYAKARQLIHAKGDIKKRWEAIKQKEKAEAQKDAEILMQIETNEKAKAGTALEKTDLGQDCYSLFQTHLMEHHFDSAAYYIEFRANVDTTNAQWQFDAAYFFSMQMDYKDAIPYYERALNIYRGKDSEDLQSYGIEMAYTLNNLANIYSNTDPTLIATSEDMFEEALDICDELLDAKYNEANAPKMLALSNLMQLYANSRRYSESENLFMEGIELYQSIQYDTLLMSNPSMVTALLSLLENGYGLSLRGGYYISPEMAEQTLNAMTAKFSLDDLIEFAEEDIEVYGPTIIRAASIMADLHFKAQQLDRSEELLKKTVEIAKKLAQGNPDAYSPGFVQQLQSLGYYYLNTGRFEESKPLFEEALETCRQLMETDSLLFAPLTADVLTNLGNLHGNIGYMNQNIGELRVCESYLTEAVEIERILVKTNPSRYEDGLCGTLASLGDLYQALGVFDSDTYTKSEACYLEVIEIERRLADNNPQYNQVALVNSLNKLGNLYYSVAAQNQDKEMFQKSENYYLEAIEIGHRLADSSPEIYDSGLAGSLLTLGNLYRDMDEFDRCKEIYEEAVEICKRHDDDIQLMSLLGELYSNLEEWDKAYRIFTELHPILKTMYLEAPTSQSQSYVFNLGNESFCAIFMKKYEEAEQCAREALEIDITQKWIFTNLAASLLLEGKYSEAEELYVFLKPELKESLLDDLAAFERAGIILKARKADVERIRIILNE